MSSILIMAGGTGGHVFPALAVADVLRKKGTQITWLGTHRGIESTIIPANDIAIEWVTVEGLRGKGAMSWLTAPFKLLRAMSQSAAVIKRLNPDCVLGMGGFVSGPGGLVAKLMGKPLIVHEQNAVAGLTNQYLAKIANKVLTGFPNAKSLPKTAEWVGNPVRQSISRALDKSPAEYSNEINILVIGGSQGALSFNKHLPKAFSQQTQQINVWHQSGKGREAQVKESLDAVSLPKNMTYKVTEFIDDMAAAYAWADVLVCRSGAMTVTECCAAAKPALLVPYPFSAGDHQKENAMTMVNAGAGLIVDDANIKTNIMVEQLSKLLDDKDKLKDMGKAAYTLHQADSAEKVAQYCEAYFNAQ